MKQEQALMSLAVSADEEVSRAALRRLVGHGPGIAGDIVSALRDLPPAEADRLVPVILRWPVDEVIRYLAPMLEDRDSCIAARAARILGRTHHPAAVPPLSHMLGGSPRHAAAKALGENGSAEGIVPLRQLLDRLIGSATDFPTVEEENPSTANLMARVIQALGRLGVEDHAHWLTAIVLLAEEPEAREAAAIALRDVPVADALDALSGALADSAGHVRRSALLALWSYRTVEAIDVMIDNQLLDDQLADAEAMLYDVVALDVAGIEADWMAAWSHRRAELPPETCLLAGKPVSVNALVGRIRASERVEEALDDLKRFYGLRLRWDPHLDEPAALIEEVEGWHREVALQFVPGRMYRFGREVPPQRLPRAC